MINNIIIFFKSSIYYKVLLNLYIIIVSKLIHIVYAKHGIRVKVKYVNANQYLNS